jgi:CRISPR-associated endonuclease Csn1
MPIFLGLDVGSNSVGSAWVDTEQQIVAMAVSVFPAGVAETEEKRGAPLNQARRQARSQRRMIDRRARRKRKLIVFLVEQGFLPRDPYARQKLFDNDPWKLRRKALKEPLSLIEFGRVLVHLAQRRGAVGVITDPEDPDEGKVKAGMDRLAAEMKKRGAETVGQFLADLMDERRQKNQGVSWREPIRNRQYRMAEDQMFFAGRELIRKEFDRIVEVQRSFPESPLAGKLTDELIKQFDDPKQTDTWRHQGLLFGQRRTYWDTGTLGRCVLEPTERCAPIADRHASYFRVVETVNNIRIQERGQQERPLTLDQRDQLIRLLRASLGMQKGKHAAKPKTKVSVPEIKQALGIKPRDKTTKLNIEADKDREINSDWFHREIVHGAFTQARWEAMTDEQRESVNRAILKFDPDHAEDADELRKGAIKWWTLDAAAADRLIEAWKARPKLEKRLKLSRRAILNLLPYMERFDAENSRWPTQQEARMAHAKVIRERFEYDGEIADQLSADRYATAASGLKAADRHYMRLGKHQIKHKGEIVRDAEGKPLAVLPPAPMLSNPVVRKAIHEVRRHLLAYLRKFRRKPDRVVIEFARGVKDTAKRRNQQLKGNREREQERKRIEEDLREWGVPESNWKRATLRVRLCREQNGVCPFSLVGPNAGRTITEQMAAEGTDVEIEHIVPEGLSGKTMSFNNVVLCFREANREKGMRTPLDWLGADKVKTMLQRLEKALIRQNRVKWERLQAPTPDVEGFRNSQLTDTAYAARQVAAYIADALFDGKGLPERGGERRIYTTKGEFTARLRADWGLHESTIDQVHGLEQPPDPAALEADPGLEQSSRRARKESGKDRTDHRHHAIDALAIAMVGPELLITLGRMAREDREYHEKTGHWPRREAVDPPKAWPTPEAFHRDVLAAFEKAVVSHRAVKRRLIGGFHEGTHFGPVVVPLPAHRGEDAATLFTNRIAATRLTPNHLRVPEGWDKVSALLEDAAMPKLKRRDVGRQLASMKDPSPGKPGIVRDRALRDRIRKCLRANGIDPDDFRDAQIKTLVAEGKLAMKSGVPIKGVVLLRTIAQPVVIPRKRWDEASGKMIPDMDRDDPTQPHPRTRRVYLGGSNHHLEIREGAAKWVGEVVTAFDAAKRNAARLDALRKAGVPASAKYRRLERSERQRFAPIIREISRRHSIVDRSANDKGRFVMSLAEGEMIYARRWHGGAEQAVGAPECFVVCKLDIKGNSFRIHFAPHWDARKASEQDRWDLPPADLRKCGPEPGKTPYKVRVDALGAVRRIDD